MDIAETGAYTRLSERTINRGIAEGQLRSTQRVPGGKRVIHRDWADVWLTDRAEGGNGGLTGLAPRRRRAS
jgi:hypothetical protein